MVRYVIGVKLSIVDDDLELEHEVDNYEYDLGSGIDAGSHAIGNYMAVVDAVENLVR